MEQNSPRSPQYTPFRRLLFPYSGEEVLSLKQSLRVLLAWMILLPISMALSTLLLTALFAYPLEKIGMFFVFTFLSGFFIFGSLGLLVVLVNNSSARSHQRNKATNGHNTNGR
ncbi:MAG: hypothetical protein NVS4B7_15710 [Ktedonobacteraceae bacterium]